MMTEHHPVPSDEGAGHPYDQFHAGHADIKVPKFSHEDAIATVYTSNIFKWHVYGAVAISLASFVGWAIQTFLTKQPLPWFLFVWGFFAITLSGQFYLYERPRFESLQFHFIAFTVINFTIFFTWLFTHNYAHAWFIEVFSATGLVLALHYCLTVYDKSPQKWLYCHYTGFTMLNLFLFTLWLDLGKGLPWFLYGLLITAIGLNIHYQMHWRQGDYFFKMHLGTFAFTNLILIFSWTIFEQKFPWFLFPLLIWGALVGVHAMYGSKLTYFAPAREEQLPTHAAFSPTMASKTSASSGVNLTDPSLRY